MFNVFWFVYFLTEKEMKNNLIKEALLFLLMLLPLVYLFFIWDSLPAKLPMHYDVHGNVNRYGSKTELILLSFLISPVVYFIFLFIPLIDPKGKIKEMGNKFFQLKTILILFLSSLTFYIIHTSKESKELHPNIIFCFLGVLFAVLGYYFRSIKSNYFIGIRTPWTLENETVWKDTHKLGSKVWMAGGALIAILGITVNPEIFIFFFFTIVVLLVLIPVIYSYRRFKALKSSVSDY